MEIRIRHENDSTGIVLGDIPFRRDAIDSVIPTIESWGWRFFDTEGVQESLIGQFAEDGQVAYFEVIVPA